MSPTVTELGAVPAAVLVRPPRPGVPPQPAGVTVRLNVVETEPPRPNAVTVTG